MSVMPQESETKTSENVGLARENSLPLRELNSDVCYRTNQSLKRIFDDQLTEYNKTQVKLAKTHQNGKAFTISVEGNIGSGKSTFLKYFSRYPEVTTYEEPVDKWTNIGGYNLMQKLYEDPKRWSFLFQSYVQLTRLKIHCEKVDTPVKLIERSFQNNRYCFVENGYKSGDLAKEEYDVLCNYFDFFHNQFELGVDLIVYLRTSPKMVFERIKKRGRKEEATISMDYLTLVHDSYEKWLLEGVPQKPPCKVITLDANKTLASMEDEYETKKKIILGNLEKLEVEKKIAVS